MTVPRKSEQNNSIAKQQRRTADRKMGEEDWGRCEVRMNGELL